MIEGVNHTSVHTVGIIKYVGILNRIFEGRPQRECCRVEPIIKF